MRPARAIARRFRHEYVGTEHMLLALLEASPNPATELLFRCGADPGRVRQAAERLIIMGPAFSWRTRWHQAIPTPCLLNAIEFGRAETSNPRNVDGRVALLMGLAHDRRAIAGMVLHSLNAGEMSLRVAID
jgi:ATP-dependent Clp protease ATP-binding subunit ClpC